MTACKSHMTSHHMLEELQFSSATVATKPYIMAVLIRYTVVQTRPGVEPTHQIGTNPKLFWSGKFTYFDAEPILILCSAGVPNTSIAIDRKGIVGRCVTLRKLDSLSSIRTMARATCLPYRAANLSSDTMSPCMRGQPHKLLQNVDELTT